MRPIQTLATAGLALALAAGTAVAANVNQPYQNVDKSNDKGNDTGDSKVGALNNAQTDQNYKGQNYKGPVTTTPAAPAAGTPPTR